MENEVWKPIYGFEGLYEVSSLGKIRSLKKDILLKAWVNNSGYFQVRLANKNLYVHRIVAMSFIDNKNLLKTVNHINGDKLNNGVNNLEWNSYSQNIKHAFKIGLKSQSGEKNNNSKITELDVVLIRKSKENQRTISIKFGICQPMVSNIKNYKNWK